MEHALRHPSIKFRILGPVEFFNGRQWAPIRATKQRTLLALLLLNANRLVPAQQLQADLWGDGLPARASSSLAGCVWRLRAALGDPSGETLLTRPAGYQLTVEPGCLDLHEYESLVAAGRAHRAAGNLAEAMDASSAALGMWRGAPLADVALTPSVMAESARLEESRLAVMEADFGVKIALGRHEEVLPELKLHVSQYPLRERLHEHLMTALYRTGQQAEALGAYRDLRRLLLDELGVDPSRPLRELMQRILEEDPELLHPQARPTAPITERVTAEGRPAPVSRLLPKATSALVGRETELATLTAALLDDGNQVCSVYGLAGSGKSTLAVHAAQAVSSHFPDGQLYLDLRSTADADGEALQPADVMCALVGAFGAPGQAALDRTDVPTVSAVLAGRKVLIVLDDVRDADQIRPLLPTPPGCSLLVTGRPPLGGVDGLQRLYLGRLSVCGSVELLGRFAGSQRLDADPASAAALARHCEYLPLALRLAAERLAKRPDWTAEDFAGLMADPEQRLSLLADSGVTLRDSLRASLGLLNQDARRSTWSALRLLGALDLTIVTVAALAALLGTTVGKAHVIAELLVDMGLVESLAIDRYRVPEAVRVLARDAEGSESEATEATEPGAAEAVQRVVDHYIAAVRQRVDQPPSPCDDVHRQDDSGPRREPPRAWYRRQRETLQALAAQDKGDALREVLDRFQRITIAGAPARGRQNI